MNKLLLCSDMDRTVIPNGVQPEDPDARRRLREFCRDPRVCMAYVSGRHRHLVQDAIRHYVLPPPDYVISDVGTKIYRVADDGTWKEVRRWAEEIDPDWNGHNRDQIKALLGGIRALRLQEGTKQNTHKVSYYLPLYVNEDAVIHDIQGLLEREGIKANVIYSVDEIKNLGLLDILPASANKLHALRFLQEELGYAQDEIIFAGDSGNDLEVLTSAIPSVLVANATDTIKREARETAERNGHPEALYIAGPGLLNMNGNYCAGVLQGVWHFAPAFRELLEKTEHSV